MCALYDITRSYEIDMYIILSETVREASEDILERVRSGFPMSEHLSTLLETHLADARARQNPLERLSLMWLWTFIELPLFLCCNCLDQLWHVVVWELRLLVRMRRCFQASCRQALLIPATIRARILSEQPDLAGREAD